MPSGPTPASDVYVRWAHLAGSKSGLGIGPDGPGLLLRLASSQQGDTISTTIDYLNNRPGAFSQTLSLDIYGAGRGNPAHYGYWNLSVPPNRAQSLALSLDPASKELTTQGEGIELAGSFKGQTGDGTYTASLLVYENGQVAETFNDMFTFTIDAGKLTAFTPRNLPPLFR
jgi:hypothetical protein